jgi:hypothetical protein
MISQFGVGGFPPFRQEKGERTGHGLVQRHTFRDLAGSQLGTPVTEYL